MTLKLSVTLRAAAQIERADRWWSENRLSAPEALREDIASAFGVLLRQPGIGTKVVNPKVLGVRRLHLGRIRYFLYYRVKEGELVVLAFWHSSRGKGPAL